MKIQSILLALFLAGTTVVMNSCKKKGCTNQYAENFESKAKKDDGSCTFARDKFFGTYAVQQNCVYGGQESYSVSVSAGPVENEVLITNFANYGSTIRAVVDGTLISFNYEIGGIVYTGDGYLINNQLDINFEMCESFYYPCSDPEICSMTGVK